MNCFLDKERNLWVDFLFILFGISAWISINGLWVELPVIVAALPEGWSLPSYLSIIVQLANIGPISYSVLRWWIKRRRNDSGDDDEFPMNYAIYSFLIIGIIAAFILIFTWNETAIIGGSNRSIGLFLSIFCLSLVDCTSSVLFFPYVGLFRPIYLNSYMIGEGLSGFIPSMVALGQGVGQSHCENVTLDATHRESRLVQNELNFSVETFFAILFVMLVLSTIAFALLDVCHFAKKERTSQENVYIVNDSPASYDGSSSTNLTTSVSRKCLILILLFQAYINFFSNGALPSIQTYSCLPYGNKVYHYVVTIDAIIGPMAALWAHFVPCQKVKFVVAFTGLGTLFMGFIFATAGASPNILIDGTLGGVLVAFSWIANKALFAYSKVIIAGLCRSTKKESSMFWFGAVSQIGSAAGALTFFIIVLFQVFEAAPQTCQ